MHYTGIEATVCNVHIILLRMKKTLKLIVLFERILEVMDFLFLKFHYFII